MNIKCVAIACALGILFASGCRETEETDFTEELDENAGADMADYMVIDLADGPKTLSYPVRYTSTAPNLNNDVCRTTELWFRLIPAGTFIMGSPDTERGRNADETPHPVTLTKPFYMGIFQVTQTQYTLVMGGTNPAKEKGDPRPAERISYDMLRGSAAGSKWPLDNEVDPASFFGKLRAKTDLPIDLPTEAQWEHACRAATPNALNNGKDLTAEDKCPNLKHTARYHATANDGKWGYSGKHTKVGMYQPNAWGLYDTHGNVTEWCLDWYDLYPDALATDPRGPDTGNGRIQRGGSYTAPASACRSAHRAKSYPYENEETSGFRASIQP